MTKRSAGFGTLDTAAASLALTPPHPEEHWEAMGLEGWGGHRGGPMVRDALHAPHHEAGKECVERRNNIVASATMLTDLANKGARFCGLYFIAYSASALLD